VQNLGFGVTIVFFYATFNGFFSLIISLFTSAIHLSAGTLKGDDYQKQATGFLDDISKFQYSTLILFMITWIIISICIEQVVQKDKSSQISLLQDNRMAKNIFVGLILAFSIYLCIASIIAIPEFQALENDTVDKQEIQVFKNMLDDSTLNKRLNGLTVNANLPLQSSLKYPSSLHRLNVVINALNLFKDRAESIKNDLILKQQQIIVNYQTALDEKTALKQRSIYKSNLRTGFLTSKR